MLVAKSSSKIPTSPPECLLEATEWTYLAEGGANVIFRYTGTHQPWLNMHVLRIQKVTSCPGKNCKSILNFVTDKVMPLLNDKYLQCGHVLEISNASFLVELNQQLCQVEHRPIHRKATLLDESATHLMLLPDLNRSQVCIELKPKSSLQPRLEGIKQEVCRYCMHQHLKLKQNAIQGISQYCPMDLFSKDLERMTKALRALEQTPQNNFRVFDPKGRAISTADVSEEYDLIPLIAHILHQMTILDDLKAMHQLDRIDIENLWQLYLYLHHSPESCPQQLDLAIQRIGHGNNWKELKEVIYPRLLDQFLLATTMKDCSILLSIGHQSHDSWSEFEHEIEYKGTKYFVIASIVDLDIKPLSKLSKYYELDQEIVSHYISANGSNGKQCFQSAITRIRQKNLMCRLLYPNPVCLLTVYDPETQRRNVMTITWLTPVDNHGTFVCSINKKRFTADLLMLNSQFVLNIPSQLMESLILQIGSCSGRQVDKFEQFQLKTCDLGWTNSNLSSSTIALTDCIAHTLCLVREKRDIGQHWLLMCQQQDAWCRTEYFKDGKTFRPESKEYPSYLTFYGSQTFGIVSDAN